MASFISQMRPEQLSGTSVVARGLSLRFRRASIPGGCGVVLPSPGSSSFAPGAWSGERGEGCPQEEPCGLRAFLSYLDIWTCAACWIPVEQSWSVVVKPVEGKLSHALLCGQVTGHRAWAVGREGRCLTAQHAWKGCVLGARCGSRVIFKQGWVQPRCPPWCLRKAF